MSFLKKHQSTTNPDVFEFRMPNLIPTKKGWKKIGILALGLIVLFLLYQLFRLIVNYPVLSALDKRKDFAPKDVSKNITLSSINQVIELPTDQNGTVGVIKDLKPLESRASFFNKARVGDILIIYPDMTIIYDPDNRTVVDTARTSLLK